MKISFDKDELSLSWCGRPIRLTQAGYSGRKWYLTSLMRTKPVPTVHQRRWGYWKAYPDTDQAVHFFGLGPITLFWCSQYELIPTWPEK